MTDTPTPPQPAPMEHNKELEDILISLLMTAAPGIYQEKELRRLLARKTVSFMSRYRDRFTALLNQEKDKVLDAAIEAGPKDMSGLKWTKDVDGDRFLHCPEHGIENCDCAVKNEVNGQWRKALHNLRNSEGLE